MNGKKHQIRKLDSSYFYSSIYLVMGIFYIFMKATPIYAINDDLFMKNIFSGAYLGVSNAYGIYMEYPLTLLMKVLYEINVSIPWYGIFLLGCHLGSIACVIQRCTCKIKNQLSRFFIFILVMVLCVIVDYSHIILIQFTVTSAVLGSVAIFWFLTSDTDQGKKNFFKDNIITILFAVLSLCIRRNVLFMLIPFAGVIWIGKWINEKRSRNNKFFFGQKKIQYIGIVGITGIAIMLILGINTLAYSSKEWKEYAKYNEAATILYDYCGWPEYESNQTLYDSLGITKEAYEGATKDYMLCMNHNINLETITELADYSQQNYDENHTLDFSAKTIGTEIIEKVYRWSDRPLNLIVAGLYVLVLMCSFIGYNKSAIIAVGCLVVGRLVVWSYIIYEGRFPVRITQSLFIAEFFLLIGIAVTYEIWKFNTRDRNEIDKRIKQGIVLIIAIGYVVVVLYLGKQQYKHVNTEVARRIITAQDLADVKEYCGERAENFYFMDNLSISYLTEKVLDKESSKYQNYILFGGWLTGSPVYKEKLESCGIYNAEKDILESDRVYVIFLDMEERSNEYLMNYFRSKYETFKYELIDTFATHNFTFKVYQLRK